MMLKVNEQTGAVSALPSRSSKYTDRSKHGILFEVVRVGPLWELQIQTWVNGQLKSTQRQTHLSEQDAEAASRRLQGADE